MSKAEFLEKLAALTAVLSAEERRRLLDYYGEMIDDRVEEGVPESEAVAALGDPEVLARELLAERPLPVPAATGAKGGGETVAALNALQVRVRNADVTVVREAIEGGAAAQLRFSDPGRFEWRMDGDALEVAERQPEGRHLGLESGLRWLRQMITEPDLKVTIALADGLPGGLDFEGVGGDIRVEGAAFAKAQLVTASGDIRLKDVDCAGGIGVSIRTHSGDVKLTDVRAANLMASAASGDISGEGLALTGRLRLETASGDLELRELRCGELALDCASGDIEVDRGTCGAARIHTASGDVRLDELETDPTLEVETAAGDISLTRCIARKTRLKAVSGDVSLRLEPLPCGYDVAANSRTGDISLDLGDEGPDTEARPAIAIDTVSGDISVKVL